MSFQCHHSFNVNNCSKNFWNVLPKYFSKPRQCACIEFWILNMPHNLSRIKWINSDHILNDCNGVSCRVLNHFLGIETFVSFFITCTFLYIISFLRWMFYESIIFFPALCPFAFRHFFLIINFINVSNIEFFCFHI